MTNPTDLDARLRAAGLEPTQLDRPICGNCGEPKQIVAYGRGQILFSCPEPACLAAKRKIEAAS